MTRPLFKLPPPFTPEARIAGSPRHEVWRGKVRGQDAALRVISFEGLRAPNTDPAEFARRMDEIARGLGLTRIARLLAAESTPEGMVLAEAWAGDRSLASGQLPWQDVLRTTAPAIADLLRLHQSRKWHGAIGPSRFVFGTTGGATLCAFPWAVVSTSFPRDLRMAIDPPSDPDPVAPELRAEGPAAAGPTLDSWGLARTLARATTGPIPQRARAVLEKASAPEPGDRPALDALVRELGVPLPS